MAHELYTRTNQKIYFAGLSLEALGRAEKGQAVNSPALLQAERESALFHLYGALLGLCHEIAGYYRLPQAGARRAEELLTQEVLDAIAIPEMAELVELAQNRQTWLAQLLSAYNALYEPPRAPKKLKGEFTRGMQHLRRPFRGIACEGNKLVFVDALLVEPEVCGFRGGKPHRPHQFSRFHRLARSTSRQKGFQFCNALWVNAAENSAAVT